MPAPSDSAALPESGEPAAETPELARIATHLRSEGPSAQADERPDGFDVNAILAAVRGVGGVRDASLRTTPAGAHRLRLDLADGADPAEVSRQVARLLQERMGLAAAPQHLPGGPHRARSTEDPYALGPWNEPNAADGAVRGSGSGVSVPRRRRSTQRGTDPAENDAGSRPAHRSGPAMPAAPGLAAGRPGLTTGNPPAVGTAQVRRPRAGDAPGPRRLNPGEQPGPRVVIDHVQVSSFGVDATVEVRLAAGEQLATGLATGPGVDGYLLRLCAVAATSAIDELLNTSSRVVDRGRCFVEHAAVVPFGGCEVAVVVVLLVCDGAVEQVTGSALVTGDPRQAVVRATLAAVNRRLAALLS